MPNKLIYLLTCKRGIKDVATGFFSYVDVFDTVFIPKETDFVWESFCVGGRFYLGTPGEINIEVTFVYPDAITISPPSIIAVSVKMGDVHFTAFFPMIRFTQVGKNKLRFSLNGVELNGTNEFYFNVAKLV